MKTILTDEFKKFNLPPQSGSALQFVFTHIVNKFTFKGRRRRNSLKDLDPQEGARDSYNSGTRHA